ncbi:MAG: multicopper oxidase family protein [Actinomycetota bacterium]
MIRRREVLVGLGAVALGVIGLLLAAGPSTSHTELAAAGMSRSVQPVEAGNPGRGEPAPRASQPQQVAGQPAAGEVREFSLTVGRMRWELAPGEVTEAYAYNGQMPGPELRVKEGDTVRVRVTNALGEPTTIHWHGVDVPAGMDGVPGLSQEPIAPGSTFTYEFVAKPAGTRWYHAHVNELVQQGGGLAGALIIEPRESTSASEREYVVMAQQWLRSSGERPSGESPGMGMSRMDGDRSSEDDRFTVNGKAYPNATPLVVRQGERVRLRLINAGTTATQVFALAGHQLIVTHTDGNALSVPVPVDTVPLGVGERADVEFLASSPGRWQLGSISSGQADRGLGIDVVYQGHEADPVQYPALGDLQLASYSAMTAGPLPTTKPDRTFELVLSGGMMSNSGAWTINGRSYPGTEPLDVRPGERVRVRMINMSMEDHPMHLHGHTFQIVAIGDRPVAGPFKDTLTLRHMDSYDVEFVAANPGQWLFHCHNLEHMMGGLMTEVRYQ